MVVVVVGDEGNGVEERGGRRGAEEDEDKARWAWGGRGWWALWMSIMMWGRLLAQRVVPESLLSAKGT